MEDGINHHQALQIKDLSQHNMMHLDNLLQSICMVTLLLLMCNLVSTNLDSHSNQQHGIQMHNSILTITIWMVQTSEPLKMIQVEILYRVKPRLPAWTGRVKLSSRVPCNLELRKFSSLVFHHLIDFWIREVSEMKFEFKFHVMQVKVEPPLDPSIMMSNWTRLVSIWSPAMITLCWMLVNTVNMSHHK